MKNIKFIILSILLLTISVGVGTYALYKNSGTSSTNIETANFEIRVNNTGLSTSVDTFDLGTLTWNNSLGTVTKNGKIAPGSYADLAIVVDASGSEVNVDYDVSVTQIPGFTILTGSDIDSNNTPATGTIAYAAGSNAMKVTVPVRVMWEGSSSDSNSKNISDLAMMNQTKSLEIEVVASQHIN